MDLIGRQSGSIQDEGPSIIGVSVGLMSFGFVLVIVRLAYRLKSTGIKTDDLLITLAVLLSLGHTINDCFSVIQYGYGKHRVDLTPAQAHAGKTTGAALGFWISQILYKLSLLCTKLSICFLYRRIFERARHGFNIALYSVMALVGLYYTAVVLVTIFECTPVSKSWIKTQPGTCINTNSFFYANAGFNIFTDVVIMALPVPVIHALHLPLRQRVMLCCIFAVGLFATATSVIRIFTLSVATQNTDTTWEVAGSTLWSSAEINVAIICACLPMLRPPLQALFPRLFRSMSAGRSNYADGQYGGRSPHASGHDRFSRRFSRQVTPGGSIAGKGLELALKPIGESKFENERSEKSSDDIPYFIDRDEDSEGILKRTDVTVVREEALAGPQEPGADGWFTSSSTEPARRNSGLPGVAL